MTCTVRFVLTPFLSGSRSIQRIAKIIFLLILLTVAVCHAQTEPVAVPFDSTILEEKFEEKKDFAGSIDTVSVQTKNFDQTTLDQLKSDPDYSFKEPPTIAESLWDRFKRWIGQLIDAILKGATTTGIGQILMYVIGIMLVSAIIMLLLKVDAFRVFYSGADRGKIHNGLFNENIHEMDFEKLIRDAAQKEEYRQGTRLILLYSLKLLADKNHIRWEAGKTNHDYVDELSTKELKTGLNEISFYFDYAWYGNFDVNKETFRRVENTFSGWRQKLD